MAADSAFPLENGNRRTNVEPGKIVQASDPQFQMTDAAYRVGSRICYNGRNDEWHSPPGAATSVIESVGRSFFQECATAVQPRLSAASFCPNINPTNRTS
jgi:hypothetical protein